MCGFHPDGFLWARGLEAHSMGVDGPGVAATGETGGSSTRGNNRGPAWARLSGTFSWPVGGPVADEDVRKGVAGHAIGPGRC